MKKTILLEGKRHSVPCCFAPLIRELENLDGVIRVGLGRFSNRSKYFHKFEWEPHPIDASTHTLKGVFRFQEYKMDLYISVKDSEGLSNLARFLNNYTP